jgi:hypothetical protein
MPRYVPILKGKAAEYAALRHAGPAARAGMLPLVEVVPPADDTNLQHVEAVCAVTVGAVAGGWGTGDPIALDPLFLPDAILPAGQTALAVLLDEARRTGVVALPVVHLGDAGAVVAAAADAHRQDRRGAVVRLQNDDLQEDVTDLNIWLADLLEELALGPVDADLIVDVGAVGNGGSSPALVVRVARDVLRGVTGIGAWRSVTFAAGAFPPSLDAIPSSSTALVPRDDAAAWRSLVARPLPRVPDFGDYAVQHPGLPANVGFGPAPQIRYALADDWRIHKGRKTDRRGHAQFFDHCAALVAAGEASPARLSFGDDYVARAAASAPAGARAAVGTGNATTWRTVGTSHHMALVIDRLSSLGVP